MSKSLVYISLRLARGGFLTPNEIRALEGFDGVLSRHAALVGEQGSEFMSNRKDVAKKIECNYCSRYNEFGIEMCVSCGAPLDYGKEEG